MIRRFVLERRTDSTGVSGTGDVAWGVVFPDGTCVLRWATEHRSTAIYDSVETLRTIHGHGGDTVIRWEAEDTAQYARVEFGSHGVPVPGETYYIKVHS